MLTILDYVSKKDSTVIGPESPLNELDALALARFSYLPFSKANIFSQNQSSITIANIAKKMQKVPQEHFLFKEDKELVLLLGKSPRFAELTVSDFFEKIDKKTVEQSAAVVIHLNQNTLFVAYMGTDYSLNGWREDCNMAIMDEVPSQKTAKKYFKTIAKKYPDNNIYVGGHSKGGNLSMYAAITAKPQIARQILSVYSFDGPGLSKKLAKKAFDANRQSRKKPGRPVLAKITNYIPQESIVGRLFSHVEKFEVIKSNAKSFFQHNIYSWEVNLKTQTIVRSRISEKSNFVDKTIAKWLDTCTKKEKKILIELIFKILENSKYASPPHVAADGLRAVPELYASFRKLDKSERKTVKAALRKIIALVLSEKSAAKKSSTASGKSASQ